MLHRTKKKSYYLGLRFLSLDFWMWKKYNKRMRKTLKIFIIIFALFFIALSAFMIYASVLTPKFDKINIDYGQDSYFIANTTYIAYQEGNECSAYATAYALRCLDLDITGDELYPQMKRSFGMMTVSSIVKTAESKGHSAKAYHGNIQTLKKRIEGGLPIICLITNGNDTHYVVAVGYDVNYVYLVDSIRENANVTDSELYNRKVWTQEFEKLWNNNFYMANNIYIVIE